MPPHPRSLPARGPCDRIDVPAGHRNRRTVDRSRRPGAARPWSSPSPSGPSAGCGEIRMVTSAFQAMEVARVDASPPEKRFDETVVGYQGARPHGKVNMDALELLKSDHDKVRGLFNDFRSAAEQDDAARMGELCSEVFNELTVHTSIEEEIFYPAVREAGGEELNEQTDESWEEHHVVDVLMEEIRALDPGDAAFKAKMTVLMENVEHHAQEEEDAMFPQVRELTSN